MNCDNEVHNEFLMGNEAIALGALHNGVTFASGYPGTPSTEILETIAKRKDESVYVEWSVNEKAALECAAGASYAGARTLVTMKQVGLNVASDPLMSLAYVGIKGGMVIVSADDPGPISSQTEQDTRTFAKFAKIPVFDPSSPEEAYEMMRDAFILSEKYATPVLFRPTTRVCHGCSSMMIPNVVPPRVAPEGFVRNPRFTIFPRLSYLSHINIEKRNLQLQDELSEYTRNHFTGSGQKGIVTGGISYAYVSEVLGCSSHKLMKISTPHPFPDRLARSFLEGLSEVIVIEELDPVIEGELLRICGANHLPVKILGKLTGHVQNAGENSVESVRKVLDLFLLGEEAKTLPSPSLPSLPVRPPVLCAGCPHRASFYAVKQAAKGIPSVFSGDIGCYTLGNALPLDMVDTCLCMGAGITIASGLARIEPETKHFAFIGDSTFFASGITGIINAVYNNADITIIVLDNSTTAMTGHQPHPGTGKTLNGSIATKISISAILLSIGVKKVVSVDPLDQETAIHAVSEAMEIKGVSAVIFKSPCIAVTRPKQSYSVAASLCIGCKKCIRELGCPAMRFDQNKAYIDPAFCYGCGICARLCSTSAISISGGNDI